MIKLFDVLKRFPDGTTALADVTFEVADGEFLFLVGPSGAGKTTLLKLLIRDFLPTSGEINIDGQNLSTFKAKEIVTLRRKIGFIFQDLKLLPTRNVFENIALALEVMGGKQAQIKEEVISTLKMVDLLDFSENFPAQLSGGELQRVAIARSIVGNPQYLLADEPTGNVDPANVWSIIKLLNKINSRGTTVIVATHDTEVVDSLKKRVIRLSAGRIVSDKKGKYN
ncbi:MAG: cell division ATP-binding protein FtsE [Patescibacteria group bacterium]